MPDLIVIRCFFGPLRLVNLVREDDRRCIVFEFKACALRGLHHDLPWLLDVEALYHQQRSTPPLRGAQIDVGDVCKGMLPRLEPRIACKFAILHG